MENSIKIEKTIEEQFEELAHKAKMIYPELEADLYAFNATNTNTNEINEYLNLINQTPQQISTNQFNI